MSLLVCLCDEAIPIMRVLILHTAQGPIRMLENRLVDCLAFKYTSNIFNHPKLCGSKHRYGSTHLNFACTGI